MQHDDLLYGYCLHVQVSYAFWYLCLLFIFYIYRGKPQEKCPLCQATYTPAQKGKLCTICKVSCLLFFSKTIIFCRRFYLALRYPTLNIRGCRWVFTSIKLFRLDRALIVVFSVLLGC